MPGGVHLRIRRDAVEYMNRDADIVFTDIMMPGMDGIQLVKYISENHPDTKVVVLLCG